MADSRRQPLAHADEVASRDRQIDALLEDGLEQYFAGRFEDAIHLWTRVLFLDRSHARARAYIERGRSALGEQQRRGEELLQASRELLNQGQTDAARQLLTEAVAARGDEVQAAALRVHLERVERAHAPGSESAPAYTPVPEPIPGWRWRPTSPALVAGTAVLIVLLATFAVAVFDWVDATEPPVLRPVSAPALPVLSRSEVAMVRARTAFSRGRLAEALQHLNGVDLEDPARPSADTLRIEIQQLLLASVRPSSGRSSLEVPRR
jgi:tetratricopeptide (TPR) repeat protein